MPIQPVSPHSVRALTHHEDGRPSVQVVLVFAVCPATSQPLSAFFRLTKHVSEESLSLDVQLMRISTQEEKRKWGKANKVRMFLLGAGCSVPLLPHRRETSLPKERAPSSSVRCHPGEEWGNGSAAASWFGKTLFVVAMVCTSGFPFRLMNRLPPPAGMDSYFLSRTRRMYVLVGRRQ